LAAPEDFKAPAFRAEFTTGTGTRELIVSNKIESPGLPQGVHYLLPAGGGEPRMIDAASFRRIFPRREALLEVPLVESGEDV
jgi:hypothetical protein